MPAAARLGVMTTTTPAGPGPAADSFLRPVKPPALTIAPDELSRMMLTAQFMALLDVFIVNVAVPTIGSELHASGAGMQLVVAGSPSRTPYC